MSDDDVIIKKIRKGKVVQEKIIHDGTPTALLDKQPAPKKEEPTIVPKPAAAAISEA